MNRNFRTLASLIAGAMLVSTAASAVAQDHPQGPPNAEAWKAHMQKHAEARAHALHDVLNLRPDQDAAFQAFIASMAPPPRDAEHGMKDHHDEMAHLTTPQRLDKLSARMAEHQARFQAHIDAVKRFYAVLSPEQQRAFDALPMMGMGHGGRGGHGGWGHEGPHGPPVGA